MSSVPARPQDWMLQAFVPVIASATIAVALQYLPLPRWESTIAPAGLAAVPEALMPGSGAGIFLFIAALLVIRAAIRDSSDKVTAILAPFLILTNPAVLCLGGDANAMALLAAITLLYWATGQFAEGIERGCITTGLAMAVVCLSSPYAAFFLIPVLAGLVLLFPRRFLRRDTAGFLLILVLPVLFAIGSITYTGIIADDPMADALFRPAGYFAPLTAAPGMADWLGRYDGYVLTPLAVSALWTAGFAPLALNAVSGGLQTAMARQAAYALIVPVLTLTIAAGLSLAPPLPVVFAIMALANLTGLRDRRWQFTVPFLAIAWGTGLLAMMLYGPLGQ